MFRIDRGFRDIVFTVIIFSFLTTALCIPVGTAGAEELNYRLKWLYNASVIGDIYALDRGLFEKNGLKPPQTWDDMLEAAKVLTKGDQYGQCGYSSNRVGIRVGSPTSDDVGIDIGYL